MNTSGSISLPEPALRLKTVLSANRWIIISIEETIKEFCFCNNITVNELSISAGWFMKSLYIDLSGSSAAIYSIREYLNKLTNS